MNLKYLLRLITAISIGILALAWLASMLGVVSVLAAPFSRVRSTSGPSMQIASVSATLPLYDPHPEDNVSKTLFFSNATSGEITLTLAISGTPPLTLTSDAAFQQAGQFFTFATAPAIQLLTYPVGINEGGYNHIVYTATDDNRLPATVTLTYRQDITAPQVGTTAITTTSANLWPVSATLYFTESSSGDFWLSGQVVDAGVDYSGTSFTSADLGCGGLFLPTPVTQTNWAAQYHLCHLSNDMILTATSQDHLGNAASTVFTLTADNTPPASAVTATVDQVVGRTPFTLTWTADDTGSGLASIALYYRRDSGPWISYTLKTASGHHDAGTFIFTSPDTDLSASRIITYSFVTAARDLAGNIEALPPGPDTRVVVKAVNVYLPVLLRNYPLVPQVAINNGATYTYRRTITLNLTATLDGGIIDQVCLWNEGETCGNHWQNFAPALPFTLTSGNGLKTIYAQVKTTSGNMSAAGSNSILLFENGDFEQDLSVGWTNENGGWLVSRVSATADGTIVSGQAALLGKTDYNCNAVPLGYAGLSQTVLVPSNGGKLKFKYFIRSQDGAPLDSLAYDDFEVYIGPNRIYNDANRVTTGLLCSLWWRVPGPNNPRGGQTAGWYENTIDLSGYAGQLVTIAFRNYSRYDHLLNTYTYLDEVRLEP